MTVPCRPVPCQHSDLKGRCTTVASSEPHPTEPIHADRSLTRDVHAGHLGCARCMQPLGDQIPSRCPECGVALDPANPRSVCDLRNRRHRVELMMALAAGIVVGGLLAFGGWFGLMKHNRWLPILNLLVPIVGLAAGPAVLCARLSRHVPFGRPSGRRDHRRGHRTRRFGPRDRPLDSAEGVKTSAVSS